jgi:hypothetical protein
MSLEDSERRRITRRQKGSQTQSIIQTGEFVGTDPGSGLPIVQSIDGSRFRGRSISNQGFQIGDPIQITSVNGGQLSRVDRIPEIRNRQQFNPRIPGSAFLLGGGYEQGDPLIPDRRRTQEEPSGFGCFAVNLTAADPWVAESFEVASDGGLPALTNLKGRIKPQPAPGGIVPYVASWINPAPIQFGETYFWQYKITYRSPSVSQFVIFAFTNAEFVGIQAGGVLGDRTIPASETYTTFESSIFTLGTVSETNDLSVIRLIVADQPSTSVSNPWGEQDLPSLFIRSIEICIYEFP